MKPGLLFLLVMLLVGCAPAPKVVHPSAAPAAVAPTGGQVKVFFREAPKDQPTSSQPAN